MQRTIERRTIWAPGSEDAGRKIAIALLEKATVEAAAFLEPRTQDREVKVSSDGRTVSADSVTVAWNPMALNIDAMAGRTLKFSFCSCANFACG